MSATVLNLVISGLFLLDPPSAGMATLQAVDARTDPHVPHFASLVFSPDDLAYPSAASGKLPLDELATLYPTPDGGQIAVVSLDDTAIEIGAGSSLTSLTTATKRCAKPDVGCDEKYLDWLPKVKELDPVLASITLQPPYVLANITLLQGELRPSQFLLDKMNDYRLVAFTRKDTTMCGQQRALPTALSLTVAAAGNLQILLKKGGRSWAGLVKPDRKTVNLSLTNYPVKAIQLMDDRQDHLASYFRAVKTTTLETKLCLPTVKDPKVTGSSALCPPALKQ